MGPPLVWRLNELGHEVVLFHRGRTQADLPTDVRHILGDRQNLADSTIEFERFAPDVVLDMIPAAERDARDVMHTFKDIAGRVVGISSQDVYRAYGRLIHIEPGPIEPVPLTEDSPLRRRLYPYRESTKGQDHPGYDYEKILVERVYTSDPQMPGTILRLPMVYGPGDPLHRLFEYLKRMDDDRPAIVLEQGLAEWRWTKGYVENVAAAIALAVTDERATGRIYNLGERETLREAEWVRRLGRVTGWQGRIAVVPRDRLPDHMVPEEDTEQHILVDTSRIRGELGYREPVRLYEALRRTIAWARANPPDEIDPQDFDYDTEDALLAELEQT